MDHQGFVVAIREQSERFLEVLAGVDPHAPVPSCPGWTAADLLWHLGVVQHFWAEVARGATDDVVVPPERPADVAALGTLVARSGTELLAALAGRDPSEGAWSWHPAGGSISWLARRQAHEALIHRVDAELTAGVDVRPPSAELALDGVDEVLSLVGGVPEWGEFAPDGTRVLITSSNLADRWLLVLGRFTGTGPGSGKDHDLDAAVVSQLAEESGAGPVDAEIAGRAWDLDRWLWGRGEADGLEISGSVAAVDRVRALVAGATD